MNLHGYQVEHYRTLLAALMNNNSALDASDTGTGKTFVACRVALELGKFPIVICPKAVIPTWNRVAHEMNSPIADAINYESIKTCNNQWLTKKRVNAKDHYHFTFDKKRFMLVFDEVQRVKSRTSQNSELLMTAKRQGYTTLSLSATAASNPMDMKALGFSLGLFEERWFYPWLFKHGVKKNHFNALVFDGKKEHLEKIHAQIFPKRGSRMRISEIPGFPETQIIPESYLLTAKDQKIIDEEYTGIKRSLEVVLEKELADEVSHLTKMLRARQRIELLKVPLMFDIARDFLEEGKAVVIFVNFQETLSQLSRLFFEFDLDAGVIHGNNQSAIERERTVTLFQAGGYRALICNIKAGGVGLSLHDLTGDHPRATIISPTWSAEELKQALGRVHRSGAVSKSIQKIIFAAGTIEERICSNVRKKLDNIELLNDGDLTNEILETKD